MASSSEKTSSSRINGRDWLISVWSSSSSSLKASIIVRISPREATLMAGWSWRKIMKSSRCGPTEVKPVAISYSRAFSRWLSKDWS